MASTLQAIAIQTAAASRLWIAVQARLFEVQARQAPHRRAPPMEGVLYGAG
ncbi:hypothetical protein [Meiothermus ruber]|jgi:hypothetical protein|uniref:Uncharacterized protein n=1 Tax=Meiothermus ruber (strain ATCC 35948 / DSM 1279 / VKM B-1258 / 21) TaxID=504728 RepID=D3PPL0_MEIRD|nr:hypothetical protein [Meiothermus ruber]ADD29624.1 hypothetical protein Mrub_2877 [Meiothermus ruber DSM 1279]AGK04923.1 hypothetical protein K649_08140 [Meiothermus ruber DSM 1279]MCL6530399.1 hypothetical protein [Meiothermus ruber]MCX7802893.1 hypothetical protein [Meiothermus ruber]